ncbi:hypothetical protein Y032_0259g503 [Ancylostoma ceylanicum]|uniref:Short-chain dehydrogenase/reductase 3 n=1 Tax=Ancylostoma ceylanicum TaxID=53326 RepID=A0A016SAN0_9BILA|nr:hypothetical protein Y032_0259g503 [Ancylostoma ceylanicum]
MNCYFLPILVFTHWCVPSNEIVGTTPERKRTWGSLCQLERALRSAAPCTIIIRRNIHMIFDSISEVFDALLSNFGPRGFKKPKDIAGQVVLVTGAGNGIGRLIATKIATTGCILVLWDIDEKGNEETKRMCDDLGAETHIYRVDMSDRQAIYSTASRVTSDVGVVNIVVNNAGILRDGGDFLKKSDDTIDATIRVNMMAHIWMAKAFLPNMIEQNDGHIVCVCSMSGIVGAKDIVDYSASKFGAFGFQEALENEMCHRKRNIHFTTICPSYIQTTMCDRIPLSSSTNFLSPNHVAEEIVHAILTNKRIVLLPKKTYFLYAAKGLIPRRTFQRLLLFVQK